MKLLYSIKNLTQPIRALDKIASDIAALGYQASAAERSSERYAEVQEVLQDIRKARNRLISACNLPARSR